MLKDVLTFVKAFFGVYRNEVSNLNMKSYSMQSVKFYRFFRKFIVFNVKNAYSE